MLDAERPTLGLVGRVKESADWRTRPVRRWAWRRILASPALRKAALDFIEWRHFAPRARRERAQLNAARRAWDAGGRGDVAEPLITIVVSTWNRGDLLTERTVPSILAQTYRNWELLVVGDCCTDDTEARFARISDPRVRFINLPVRGDYPRDPALRWMVAGASPCNHAFRIAHGDWVAQSDDDDTWSPDHLEVLLRAAQTKDLEMVYGITARETEPGEWVNRGDADFSAGACLPSAILMRRYMTLFHVDPDAWRVVYPADKHRWRRMRACGARVGFVDQVVAHSPLRPGQGGQGHRSQDREDLGVPMRKYVNALDLIDTH